MKKAIIAGLILLALAGGVWFGRNPYRHWKQERFLNQARDYLTKGDYRNAVFSARETLAVNPGNGAAAGIIAQIAEADREPGAIAWRSRIVEMDPSTSNRIELARTALLFGDPRLADRALAAVKESERDTVDYHTVMSLVAAAQRNYVAAESNSARAVVLDPTNHILQLNLATLRLQSTDAARADAATKSLEQLAADPLIRRDALRQLAISRLARNDFAGAEKYSKQVQAEKPPLFRDDLLHLTILRGENSGELTPFLASVEKNAAQSPQSTSGLADWMASHQMTDEELRWLRSFPTKKPSDPILTEVMADCLAQRGDWAQVEATLTNQNWGEMDFIRHAKLARAARQLKKEELAQLEWHSAVASATGHLRSLSMLLTMSQQWGWNAEREGVAWLIVQRFPNQSGLLEMLAQLYTTSGNTPGLQRVFALAMKDSPNNIIARNNFAAASLLLGIDLDEARRIAREDYDRAPQDGNTVSTYAFALYLQGKTQEGLQIMEKLKPAELQKPTVAVYYGVLLAAAGERKQAKPWLDLGEKAPLLPEEKKALEIARNTAGK